MTSAATKQSGKGSISRLLLHRTLLGLVTLCIVSMLVFFATHILPGNAATAVLGQSGTPKRVQALEQQLNLDQPVVPQYLHWLKGLVTGDLGRSLSANYQSHSL